MFVQLYMQLLRSFFLLLAGVVFSSSSHANETITGCKIGNNEFVYATYQGVQPYPVSQWYIPTFPTYTTPTKQFLQAWYNNYASCPQFVGQPSYGGQCAVQGITHVSNGQVKNLGNTVTYTVTYECPLDSKTTLLLFAIGTTSVFYLRRELLARLAV